MNHRPIVLPGIATGVVLLAAMVGFVKLPAEGNAHTATPATASSATELVSACRGWKLNDYSGALDKALDPIRLSVSLKKTTMDELQTFSGAINAPGQALVSTYQSGSLSADQVAPVKGMVDSLQGIFTALGNDPMDYSAGAQSIKSFDAAAKQWDENCKAAGV